MNRTLITALATLLPAAAGAQLVAQPVVVGASYTLNNSPGSQTDPHVSGDFVAYTDETFTTSQIRVHTLSTGTDVAIPNGGNKDILSDIFGSRVVFTRLGTTARSIHLYDIAAGTTVELSPAPGSMRNSAAIGGDTVAWEDTGITGISSSPEIVVYDLGTGTTSQLTHNALYDGEPGVSPNGDVVVYTECTTTGTQCDVYQATRVGTTWTTQALTGSAGEDARASTDGVIVAYESERPTATLPERDLYYQPVGGGAEVRIPLGGDQHNASVAGQLIAFENRPAVFGGNYDLDLYDTRTGLLYELTHTPEDEVLTDIDVDPVTGLVRVAYMRVDGGDNNVYAFTFVIASGAQTCGNGSSGQGPGPGGDDGVAPSAACAAPGSRPLLATVPVTRTTGAPNLAGTTFMATAGPGLLCVENGAPTPLRATAGWVDFDGSAVVSPNAFHKSIATIGRDITLQASNSLSARIAGTPGASYTVRVYGPDPSTCTTQAPSIAASTLRVHDLAQNQVRTIAGRHLGAQGFTPGPDASAVGGQPAQGCSSSGSGPLGSGLGAGVLAMLALLGLAVRRSPVRAGARDARR